MKQFADKNEISFPLLSDESSKTIDAYGIRNSAMDKNKRLAGIPHPGTYVLDAEGVVIGKLFKEKYAERHANEDLIKLVEELSE